jgi:hypothetical protein
VRRQGLHVSRTYDGEVPPVERHDLVHGRAFGERDDRRVGRTEREIVVPAHQLAGAPVVSRGQVAGWKPPSASARRNSVTPAGLLERGRVRHPDRRRTSRTRSDAG